MLGMCTDMCTCGKDPQGFFGSRWRVYCGMCSDMCTCGRDVSDMRTRIGRGEEGGGGGGLHVEI